LVSRNSNKVVRLLSVIPLSLALTAGCTAQTSTESQTRSSSEDLSLLGLCVPFACCTPPAGGWQDNDFENQLKSLGCKTPGAYTPSYRADDWWVYSICPRSAELDALVGQYSNTAPYDAADTDTSLLAQNPCALGIIGDLLVNDEFVQWDPTCENCSYRQ
jgi:hypothetical protein